MSKLSAITRYFSAILITLTLNYGSCQSDIELYLSKLSKYGYLHLKSERKNKTSSVNVIGIPGNKRQKRLLNEDDDNFFTTAVDMNAKIKSIKLYQKFNNLTITGELDEETKAELLKPRCGNSDILINNPASGYDMTIYPAESYYNNDRNNSNKFQPKIEFETQPENFVADNSWKTYKIGLRGSAITFGLDGRHQNYEIMSEKLTTEQVCIAILRAFKTWELAADIKFREINYGQDIHCGTYLGLHSRVPPMVKVSRPNIQLGFFHGQHGDNQRFDGVSGTLAHAYYPGTSSYAGLVHFDRDEPWTLDMSEWVGNDLFLVATHEIGHALGIGHSSVRGTIMYPAYQSVQTTKFKLHNDDLNAIRHLYGSKRIHYDQSNMHKILLPKSPEIEEDDDGYESPTRRPFRPKPGSPDYGHPRPTNPSKPYTPDNDHPEVSPHEKLCSLKKFQAAGFYRGEFWLFNEDVVFRKDVNHDWTAPTVKSIWNSRELIPKDIDDFFESRDPSQTKTNGMLYLIAGPLMFKYDGTELEPGWPRALKYLGKRSTSRIIGSTYWTKTNVAYLFDDRNMYYKYDCNRDKFDTRNYPKHISRNWLSIQTDFDTVFNGINTPIINDIARREHKYLEKDKTKQRYYNRQEQSELLTFFVKGNYYEVHHNGENAKIRAPNVRHFRIDFLGCRNGPSFEEPGTGGSSDENEPHIPTSSDKPSKRPTTPYRPPTTPNQRPYNPRPTTPNRRPQTPYKPKPGTPNQNPYSPSPDSGPESKLTWFYENYIISGILLGLFFTAIILAIISIVYKCFCAPKDWSKKDWREKTLVKYFKKAKNCEFELNCFKTLGSADVWQRDSQSTNTSTTNTQDSSSSNNIPLGGSAQNRISNSLPVESNIVKLKSFFEKAKTLGSSTANNYIAPAIEPKKIHQESSEKILIEGPYINEATSESTIGSNSDQQIDNRDSTVLIKETTCTNKINTFSKPSKYRLFREPNENSPPVYVKDDEDGTSISVAIPIEDLSLVTNFKTKRPAPVAPKPALKSHKAPPPKPPLKVKQKPLPPRPVVKIPKSATTDDNLASVLKNQRKNLSSIASNNHIASPTDHKLRKNVNKTINNTNNSKDRQNNRIAPIPEFKNTLQPTTKIQPPKSSITAKKYKPPVPPKNNETNRRKNDMNVSTSTPLLDAKNRLQKVGLPENNKNFYCNK